MKMIHSDFDAFKKSMNEFEDWWNYDGSGMTPLPEHDIEEHSRRIAKIAWLSGAYIALNHKKPSMKFRKDNWPHDHPLNWDAAAAGMPVDESDTDPPPQKASDAPAILRKAAQTIEDRAAERDLPAERSMARAVGAFNTLTGQDLTETQGWLFVAVLKLARATAGKHNPDDLLDAAAYVALALEAEIGGKQ